MAKIVLSMDGVILQEMVLSKERITIGRRQHNDLVIDNSAISAEHAVIVTMLRDAYLEDLNSTNGTRINGQAVKKHFLKHNDVIELAKYKIRFVHEEDAQDDEVLFQNKIRKASGINYSDSIGIGSSTSKRAHRDGNTVVLTTPAMHINVVIKIISGPNAGKEIQLAKPLTTIGLPGQQVAVITHREQAYSLTHVEGATYPIINGKEIGANAYALTSGDQIELSGIRMAFSVL
jgi:pSer/pThr/pTyr-binding forkhead associated (FHA) protein